MWEVMLQEKLKAENVNQTEVINICPECKGGDKEQRTEKQTLDVISGGKIQMVDMSYYLREMLVRLKQKQQ